MTTYNTYAAAKIANPESDIYRVKSSSIDGYVALGVSDFIELNDGDESSLCNPADHCMTVEKFLADRYKFVSGDIYLDNSKCVRLVGAFDVAAESANTKGCCDDLLFILRAAALEDKPKRTKVKYVKCEFIKLSDAAKAVDNGDIQFNKFGNQPIDDKALALHYYNNGTLSFYRRIETEIDERQEFIDAVSEILPEFDKRTIPLWIGRLYDSGKFKLANGEW